jgi:hypothetical protein
MGLVGKNLNINEWYEHLKCQNGGFKCCYNRLLTLIGAMCLLSQKTK